MSKASPVLNLSEDIFAGFNVLMRHFAMKMRKDFFCGVCWWVHAECLIVGHRLNPWPFGESFFCIFYLFVS